jgi:hypothetical protein
VYDFMTISETHVGNEHTGCRRNGMVFAPIQETGIMKTSHGIAALVLIGIVVVSSQPVMAAGPCGKWSGRWCSTSNGRSGRLTARVEQVDVSTYQVRFTGTFMKVIPFTYSVPMTVTAVGDGRTHLSGQSRLPMFGNFCCNAEITACDFVASYSSEKDSGQFILSRR